MKKYYKLLYNTPEFRRGAIFEYRSPYAGYTLMDKSFAKDNMSNYYYRINTVESQPDWFERIKIKRK